MAKTKFCIGISALSDTYSGIILDQWGVIHNGRELFEGVIDCMHELRDRKKTIILLSNSSNTAAQEKEKLKKMGFTSDFYDEIMTSGEYIHRGLINKDIKPFDRFGDKVFMFDQKRKPMMLEGTGVEVVDNIKDAQLLIITGFEQMQMPDVLDKTLREGVRKQIPCICANPDSRQLITGDYIMGAGLISRKYHDFGGVVHYIGKPHKPIFDHCIRYFQEKEIYPGSIVVIGDTMAHDILGGGLMNLDTALIKSGLHATVFHRSKSPAETDSLLKGLMAQYNNTMPRYLVERFQWGDKLPDRKHRKWKRRKTKLTPRKAKTS